MSSARNMGRFCDMVSTLAVSAGANGFEDREGF
jgi:hypothetical protein